MARLTLKQPASVLPVNEHMQSQGQALDRVLAAIEALAECEPWTYGEESSSLVMCWCCMELRGHMEGCEWAEFQTAFKQWKSS